MGTGKKNLFVCICVILICLLFLYGCKGNIEEPSYVEQEVTDVSLYIDSENITQSSASSVTKTFSLPINIAADDVEKEYYFSAEGGIFLVMGGEASEGQAIDSETALHSGDTVLWVRSGLADEYYSEFRVGVTCVEVRIEKAGNIVGYAVIRLECEESGTPAGEVVRYIEFPLVEDKYQTVSAEYVDGEIEKVKLEIMGSDSEENSQTGGQSQSIKAENGTIIQTEASGDILVTEYWYGNAQLSNGESVRELICLNGDEDTQYWFTVDKGSLKADGEFAGEDDGDGHSAPLILSGNATLRIDRTVYEGTRLLRQWKGESTYINVLKYKDDHIVGYGVVYLDFPRPEEYGFTCRAELIAEVDFPLVDGGYQEISEEYVWTEIEKVKSDHEEATASPYVEAEVTDESIYADESQIMWKAFDTENMFTMPIEIASDDSELEYYFCVGDGCLWLDDPDPLVADTELSPDQAVHSGDTILWKETATEDDYKIVFLQGVTWAEVRIKKDGNIVGYAVMRLEREESGAIDSELIRHIEFPLVDGAYQPVTEEYVDSQINLVKLEWEGVQNGTAWLENAEGSDAQESTGYQEGTVDEASIVWNGTSGDIMVTELWDWTERALKGEVVRELVCLNAADNGIEYWFTIDDGTLAADEGFESENDGDGHDAPLILSGNASLHMRGKTVYEGTRYIKRWRGDLTYINVIMYKDDHIVGYAVISLYFPDASRPMKCEAKLMEQVEFPQVDGAYQEISEEYVWSRIEKVKENIEQ